MKIPEKIKIGGHIVKVIYPYCFKEILGTVGQWDSQLKEIRITDKDPGGSQRAKSAIIVTFIHEVLHAIDNLTGRHNFEDANGEKAVEGYSEAIYQVLIDNGWLNINNL